VYDGKGPPTTVNVVGRTRCKQATYSNEHTQKARSRFHDACRALLGDQGNNKKDQSIEALAEALKAGPLHKWNIQGIKSLLKNGMCSTDGLKEALKEYPIELIDEVCKTAKEYHDELTSNRRFARGF